MDEGSALRLREPPEGGSRIAWGYLGAVAAAMLGGLGWVAANALATTVCGDASDAMCNLGWFIVTGAVSMLLALGLSAWFLRLGWEWWLVVATIVLSAPLWVEHLPSPTLGAAIIIGLSPALAALATWRGPHRHRWRPWLIAGSAAAALAATLPALL